MGSPSAQALSRPSVYVRVDVETLLCQIKHIGAESKTRVDGNREKGDQEFLLHQPQIVDLNNASGYRAALFVDEVDTTIKL